MVLRLGQQAIGRYHLDGLVSERGPTLWMVPLRQRLLLHTPKRACGLDRQHYTELDGLDKPYPKLHYLQK